jgi:3-mercaptopyruvate sulfurtransferase SseA
MLQHRGIPPDAIVSVFCSHVPEKLGITPDTHVVLYDTLGVFSAPRGAFTFKRESGLSVTGSCCSYL